MANQAAITVRVKSLGFNKKAVGAAKDKATIRFLFKAGALVRLTAKGLLKPSRQSSKPGRSPNSHTKRLRSGIFFAVGEFKGKPDCVIGPTKLSSTNRYVKTNGIPIGKVLEYGGQVLIQQELYSDGTWRRAGLRKSIRVTLPTRWVRISILARPFMRPALRMNAPKFAGIWRGLFKKDK